MLTNDAKKLQGMKSIAVPSFDGVISADDDEERDVLADMGDLTYDQIYQIAKNKFPVTLTYEIRNMFPNRKPGRPRKSELIKLLS